jgi:zinc transporter ZupT
LSDALLYAVIAGAATILGGAVITSGWRAGRQFQRVLIGFGAGYMLAVAFMAMLPHAFAGGPTAAVAALLGYLLIHLTQHVLTPHFHFGEETHHEEMLGRSVGISALLGLLLHTFFDGVAIASGFGVSQALGMLVFTAIVLHKVPEGVTLASIMLASGNSRRAALGGVVVLGVVTVLGVVAARYVGPLERHGLALSGGVAIYVAASNLIPELQNERGWRPALPVFLGVGLFFAGWYLMGGGHG